MNTVRASIKFLVRHEHSCGNAASWARWFGLRDASFPRSAFGMQVTNFCSWSVLRLPSLLRSAVDRLEMTFSATAERDANLVMRARPCESTALESFSMSS